jgi:hypothetical protein
MSEAYVGQSLCIVSGSSRYPSSSPHPSTSASSPLAWPSRVSLLLSSAAAAAVAAALLPKAAPALMLLLIAASDMRAARAPSLAAAAAALPPAAGGCGTLLPLLLLLLLPAAASPLLAAAAAAARCGMLLRPSTGRAPLGCCAWLAPALSASAPTQHSNARSTLCKHDKKTDRALGSPGLAEI